MLKHSATYIKIAKNPTFMKIISPQVYYGSFGHKNTRHFFFKFQEVMQNEQRQNEAVYHTSANSFKEFLVYIALRLSICSCATQPQWSVATGIILSKSPGPQFMCAYSWTSWTAHSAISSTICILYTSCFRQMYVIPFNHSEGDSCNHTWPFSSIPNS